jgi:hypothetical protein
VTPGDPLLRRGGSDANEWYTLIIMLARLALAAVALLSAIGCAEGQYRTTDGKSWPGGVVFESTLGEWVVVHSAEHDLSCPTARVTLPGSSNTDWIVEACGQRATYRFVESDHTWQPVMLSRVTMTGCSVDCGPPVVGAAAPPSN